MEKICIWCKAGKHFIFLPPLLYFYYIYVCVCIYNLFKLVLYVKMSWAFLAALQRKTWYSGKLNIHLGSLRTLRCRALMETYRTTAPGWKSTQIQLIPWHDHQRGHGSVSFPTLLTWLDIWNILKYRDKERFLS